MLGGDSGVLDERNRLGIAHLRHGQPQRGLAQIPDPRLVGVALGPIGVVAEPAAFEVGRQCLDTCGRVVEEFDDQYRAGIALYKAPQRLEFDLAAGRVEDKAVDQFDGGGAVFEDDRGRRHCFEHVGELNAADDPVLGQGYQPQLGCDGHSQRTLRSDHDAAKVERTGCGQEFVEVVAADPAQDFGVAAADLVLVRGAELAHGAVAFALEIVASAFFVQRRVVEPPHGRQRAVGEHHFQFFDVVDGFAVDDRAGARRVVGDHAADSRAAGGR